ncbi:hypothetical protein [Tessaracoccus coleopterorum]|nr:hypothetical protein [Tessaracoccus coleopterorum]
MSGFSQPAEPEVVMVPVAPNSALVAFFVSVTSTNFSLVLSPSVAENRKR